MHTHEHIDVDDMDELDRTEEQAWSKSPYKIYTQHNFDNNNLLDSPVSIRRCSVVSVCVCVAKRSKPVNGVNSNDARMQCF